MRLVKSHPRGNDILSLSLYPRKALLSSNEVLTPTVKCCNCLVHSGMSYKSYRQARSGCFFRTTVHLACTTVYVLRLHSTTETWGACLDMETTPSHLSSDNQQNSALCPVFCRNILQLHPKLRITESTTFCSSLNCLIAPIRTHLAGTSNAVQGLVL